MDIIDLSQNNMNDEEPTLRRSMRILKRRTRTLKKSKSNKQGKPTFKVRVPNQDGTSGLIKKLGVGRGSQIIKPTCSTCR